jgi:hypothetical protein
MPYAESTLRDTCDHSATLDLEPPSSLQYLSFAHAISSFPGLTTLDFACFSHSKHARPYHRDTKLFHIPDNEELSVLRTGSLITCLRLANWSDDRTLLNKLHTTLFLWDASVPYSFLTTVRPLVAASRLHPLRRSLEPPVPPSSIGSQIPTTRYARTSLRSSSYAS